MLCDIECQDPVIVIVSDSVTRSTVPHVELGVELPMKAMRRFAKISQSMKAPTRAFSWLKVAISPFTFKTPLRHCLKTPKHGK